MVDIPGINIFLQIEEGTTPEVVEVETVEGPDETVEEEAEEECLEDHDNTQQNDKRCGSPSYETHTFMAAGCSATGGGDV